MNNVLHHDFLDDLYSVAKQRDNQEQAANAPAFRVSHGDFIQAYMLTFDYLGGPKPYITSNTRKLVLITTSVQKW